MVISSQIWSKYVEVHIEGLTHHWHQRPLLLGSLLLSLSGGFERATPKSLACTQATGLLLLPGQLLMCVHLLLQLLMCAHLVLCSCVYICYCSRNLTPSHLLLQLLMCVLLLLQQESYTFTFVIAAAHVCILLLQQESYTFKALWWICKYGFISLAS